MSNLSKMKKRSFSIAGHRTSVALEPEFWAAIEAEARREGISMSALVTRIDAGRAGQNLASALRVHVLNRLRTEPGDKAAAIR